LSGFCTGVAGVPGLGYAAARNLGQRTPQEDLIFVGYQVIDESSTEYKRYENVKILSFFFLLLTVLAVTLVVVTANYLFPAGQKVN
jgi:hypothetical protein